MNNGASITPSSTQVSIFASTSSTRAAMINGAISTSNVLVVAAWPCTSLGGIVYAGTINSGFGTETCLSLGTQGKVLQAGGSNAPVWTPFKFPTAVGANNTPLVSNGTDYLAGAVTGNTSTFVTSDGTVISGNVGQIVVIDANGNLTASGLTVGGAVSACYQTTVSSVNTTASGLQNLMSCSIPGGSLNAVGTHLHIEASGTRTVASGNTLGQPTAAFTLGGTTLCTKQATVTDGSTNTNIVWKATCDATVAVSGASGTFEASEWFSTPASSVAGNLNSYLSGNTGTVGTFSLGSALTLQVQLGYSVSGTTNNNFTERMLRVRIEN